MSNELTYENTHGETVFTAHYLRKRGTCCKSFCLHCPYGLTLKKHGLQFRAVTEDDYPFLESLMKESGESAIDLRSNKLENIQLILLKEQICGFFVKNHIVIKHLYLKPHFQHQNISKELVEAYFF